MNNPAALAMTPISIINSLASLGVLVCFILVTVKMFQNKDTAGGVISIVTLLICCLGLIFNVNFILGWTKASRWNMKNLMYIYTGFFAVYLITFALSIPQQITMFQQQMEMVKQQQQQQQQQQQGGPGMQPMPIPAPGQAVPVPVPPPGAEGEAAPGQDPN
ncbi:MAG: hypothetical protein U0800_07015 [Isosphaeraceae bacterium]